MFICYQISSPFITGVFRTLSNIYHGALTLPVPILDEEGKKYNFFYFHTYLWFLKRFYEGIKGFMKTLKPFVAAQRSMKIKIEVNFYFKTTF